MATSDVDVVAVADPLEDSHRRAQEMLGLSGADCYRDHRAVLDRGDIDFVDISTPHHTHREILEAAAETGTPAVCDKPLAMSLAEPTR